VSAVAPGTVPAVVAGRPAVAVTAPTLGLVAPAGGPSFWLAVVLLLLVLAAVTVVCVVRARRLDRLHRRTDAARAGLADALERRGTVALQVADALLAPAPGPADRGPAADRLRVAAREALAACPPGLTGAALEPCEVAENALTRRLAAVDRHGLPPALAGELVDAEQIVVLARRVYNDAVRDTLDLRSRRLVRGLRLAGTAPVPAYFEIADPPRITDAVLAPTGASPAPSRSPGPS
jgi:heme exporter protein D